MRWPVLFAVLSAAVAEQTCTLGRLFVSDVGSSKVLSIDIDTWAETTIDGAGLSNNPILYASSGASHVFLNHRTENGVVRIVDAGFDLESHGDHYDISKEAPAVLSLKVEGDMPTHITQGYGQTTIFFDGRRESESSVIALDDTSGKLRLGTDSEVVTTFMYGPMDPQHGTAGAMANNLYFVTVPNPDFKTFDSDSSLALGLLVVDKQGNTVYDANVAGDADRSCPAYHGHGQHGEYHVFGCGDGIFVLHQDTATNAISSRKIPYHDTGRKIGTFSSHHENPVIIGQYSSPYALIRWATGPGDYDASSDVLEFPEDVEVCKLDGTAFELVHGDVFLILASNGTLLAYDVSEKWTFIASLPLVVPAFKCGGLSDIYPRLVAGYNRVFVTVPETKLVKEIKVGEDHLELGREFPVEIEPGFAAVAGLSVSQAKVGACSEDAMAHVHDHGSCGVVWIGATTLKKGIYTILLSKVDGEYAASSIAMFVRKVGGNYEDELESLQEQAEAAMACDDHDDHDHRRAGLTETSGTQGSHLSLVDDQNLLSIDMDAAAVATLLTLDVPDVGTYLFFASHAPLDFQDATAWLLDPDGENVEFEDIVGGAECRSELSRSEVWGYSFLGTFLCAITSLVGVLFLIPVLRDQREQIIIYLHSFAAGVLLSLVVVHLIPEAIALADKSWKVSTCIMAGFAAGLLIEHGLRIFGNGRDTHEKAQPEPSGQGGMWHRSVPAPIPDPPVAAVHLASSENNSCPPAVKTGQATAMPGPAPPPSVNSSAQLSANATNFVIPHTFRQYPAPGQQFVSESLTPSMLPVYGVNFGQLSFPNDGSVPPPQLSAADGTSFSQLVVTNPQPAMIAGSALGLHTPEEPESMEEGQGSLPVLGKATEVLPNGWALAMNIILGDLFHNAFDGVIIATGFRVCGHKMGWILTAASIVHELPQEISDFVILVECGLSWQMALWLNFLSSLSAIFGAFVLLGLGEITSDVDHTMGLLLGMGAGIMLYIATGLIPGIVAIEDFGKARLSWLMFSVGACCIGVLQLWHSHCICEENLPPGIDPHAGHNH